MSKKKTPVSVLDKWLFYDNNIGKPWLAKYWDVSPAKLRDGIRFPWKFMNMDRMVDVSRLCNKKLPEVLYACARTPQHVRNEDELNLYLRMKELGII